MSTTDPVPLSDVVDLERSVISASEVSEDDGYVGLEDIEKDSGRILSYRNPVEIGLKGNAFKFNEHHVLYGKLRPYLNKVALPARRGICSTDILPIQPKQNLVRQYLGYFMRTPAFVDIATRRSNGANLPRLSPTQLLQIQIPLPPLAEQKRIAAILEKADRVRQKRAESLRLSRQLIQSIFLDMFGDPATNPKGWPMPKLPEVIFFQEGPGIRKWQFQNEGIKLLNVTNIVDGVLDLSNTSRFISKDEVKKRYSHFLCDENDIVMASSGVTWGKTAIIEKRHLPLCMNTSTIRFRPADEKTMARQFLRAILESNFFKAQITKLITGSAQPNFGPAHLKQVQVLHPPITKQHEFARIIDTVKNAESVLLRSDVATQTFFHSLLSRAFGGGL